MAALAATVLNGVKIYNLASGKTLPQWIAEKEKKSLSKDEDYRKRVELLQDFHFASGSQRIKMSKDQQFVVATGMYPPVVKVYDVRDLSLKFERGLDAEVVQFEILTADAGKLCLLQCDRTISFHAPYGKHHSLRIPTFGRDMAYHKQFCDLFVASAGSEVYRLNLEQGQFMSPFQISSSGANVVKVNPVHQLVGVGCDDGILECWDPRVQNRVGLLDCFATLPKGQARNSVAADIFSSSSDQITSLAFNDDGLTFAVGTSGGHCLLYDLRSSSPVLTKEHQYGLDIVNVQFHNTARKVVSCDSKVMKVWDAQDGKPFTSIETPAEIRDVCMVECGSNGHSGVFLVAGEQERVMAYYVPEMGIAPKWCSFLDSLTEELEQEARSAIYDDYRFITSEEMKALGLEHLLGTPLVRAYMHGFFMNARLYNKVKAIAEPFAYEVWRKQQIAAKMEAKQANRISIKSKLPKVNRAAAERLISASAKRKVKNAQKADGLTADSENVEDALLNPLGDDRFAKMFESKDFEIDEENETYRQLHPTSSAHQEQRRRQAADIDSDEASEISHSDREGQEQTQYESEVEELEGKGSDESSSEDEVIQVQRPSKKAPPTRRKATEAHKPRKVYELANNNASDLLALGSQVDRMKQRTLEKVASIPLSDRVKGQGKEIMEQSKFVKHPSGGSAYVREINFYPSRNKSDRNDEDLSKQKDRKRRAFQNHAANSKSRKCR